MIFIHFQSDGDWIYFVQEFGTCPHQNNPKKATELRPVEIQVALYQSRACQRCNDVVRKHAAAANSTVRSP